VLEQGRDAVSGASAASACVNRVSANFEAK
jgi:hypothetical protein